MNRSFKIKLDIVVSHEATIGNGIPQDSLLGPLLFNIFINILCNEINKSNLLFYGDDLKIFRKLNNAYYSHLPQKEINKY